MTLETIDVNVLNDAKEVVHVIDDHISFIWVERHRGFGDVEIQLPANSPAIQHLAPGYFLTIKNTDRAMIIESILSDDDIERGSTVTVGGRSLESVLTWRVVWDGELFVGNMQDSLKNLINNNVVSPTDTNRLIPEFVYTDSTDPAITSLTHDAVYHGETVYDVLVDVCKLYDIGFKIVLNDDMEFEMTLEPGVDHSYGQSSIPHIVFSPQFENLMHASFFVGVQKFKNVAHIYAKDTILGEMELETFLSASEPSGVNRRETFVDGSSVQRYVGQGQPDLSDDEYTNALYELGDSELAELSITTYFDGEMTAQSTHIYGADYLMGDVVQVEDAHGRTAQCRVVEMLFSQDANGIKNYPSFRSLF